MTISVLVLLLACVIVGAGLSHHSDLELKFEERIFYGGFFGLIVFTIAGWFTTRLTSFSGPAVLAAILIALAVSASGWWRGRELILEELADLKRRVSRPLAAHDNPTPFLFFLIPSWAVATRILRLAYQTDLDGGIASGHLATFSDWQAHLGYTASFVYANNTGLDLPTASGYDLTYHAGINYFASLLVPAGSSLTDALTISAGYSAFLFPAAMYLAGVRIFESRAVAMLGTAIFFLFGGWGWTDFLSQVREAGPFRIFNVLGNLPQTYTRAPENDYWIENPVIGHLFPQRPTLIGFPIVIIVFALLWTAWRTRNLRAFAFCGVVIGLMPWFNLFAFGVPLAMAGVWAAIDIARTYIRSGEFKLEWVAFFVPLIVLALPIVLYMSPPEVEGPQSPDWWYLWAPQESLAAEANQLAQQLGDADPQVQALRAEVNEGVGLGRLLSFDTIGFWFKNMGLLLPLILVAQLWRGTMRRELVIASLPMWAWFIIPNFVRPHPWSGNNTHYFIFMVLLGAFPVAAVLVRVIRSTDKSGSVINTAAVYLVGLILATMTFAGALDIISATDQSTGRAGLMSGADVAVGEWARDNTDPEGVFVIATSHLHPIPALGGRSVVAGFNGWIYDLSIPDWGIRNGDSGAILRADPGHEDLLDKYDVNYVVIGPFERGASWSANQAYWDSTSSDVVYDFGGYRIYEVAS